MIWNLIEKKVREDWERYYYKVSEPDESNMGDVATWAIREYLRKLLGYYSCNFCYVYFESEDDLCSHLNEKHKTRIINDERHSGYCEYSNSYYHSSVEATK